jgi:succinyl-CoA synthetase beta subunit
MTVQKVRRNYSTLIRFVERKTRRKIKVKPKLRFHGRGRVGSVTLYENGKSTISVSRKVAKTRPELAKSIIVHELGETVLRSHAKAQELQRQYLKSRETSYRKEAGRYRRF